MPLKRHAISTNTPKNVVLGSGILVKNLVYSGSDWTYDELGATSGGGKISYEREYIDLDVDGKTVKVENFDVKVAETGLMTLNLAECNAETLVTALCLKADTTNPVTGLAKYKPSKENAYVEKLGFVGKITNVNVEPITDLLQHDYIPVVSTVGCDNEGNVYNIDEILS